MSELTFLLLVAGLVFAAFQNRRLRREIDSLGKRLTALEGAPTQAAPAPEKAPPPVVVAPPSRPVPPPARAPIDWEMFMGVKLFAWLGGLALFLGIACLIKYSFENNLITPLGRVVIGGTVGGALVGLGWWLARGRYGVTAQSLCATGLVILYADLFAVHSFYGLISLTTAFFALAAVTLGSFLLAVNLSAQVVVILGVIGGFLTPALLPSAVDRAPALFLYLALLDGGVLAVALRKRWHYLVLLAAVGTALTELGWAAQFFNAASGGRSFWIFLGFEAFFLGACLAEDWRGKAQGRASQSEASTGVSRSAWLAAAAAVAGFTALGFGFWITAVPALARQPLFFFSFIFLADAGLLALTVLGRSHRGIALAAGALTFALVAAWLGLFAPQASLFAALGAIVIFALLHAATTPASAWRPAALPFTAAGTLTPYFLLLILLERVGLVNPTPALGVALLLSALLLASAILRRADWLSAAALLGAALVQGVWQNDCFTPAQAIPTLVCYGLFLVLFVVFPFCSAEKEKAWAWAVSALAQALAFWLAYRVIAAAFPSEWMGLLPAFFILPAALGVGALRRFYRADPATGDSRLAWQGGVLLLFVSLIFPLQFEREWITLGWALEGFALLALFQRLPHRGLRVVAVLLLGAAFGRLACNPAVFQYHKRNPTPPWNWYLYAYGCTSACLLAGAAVFGPRRANALERAAPPFLGSLGAILAFLLLNLEIADYFSIGPTLTFSCSGNFARDMTYSIAWALFALGLILVGMRIQQKAARYAGVALLGVTLAKLFLHDLSDLAELYRIGAFVGVALILIAASFLYQRFLAPAAAPPGQEGGGRGRGRGLPNDR